MDLPHSIDQPHRITETDFKARFREILQQAQGGTSFLVLSGDQILAEIRPPPKAPTEVTGKRIPGRMKGRIWMAPDFDTWPDDILDAMEGRDE